MKSFHDMDDSYRWGNRIDVIIIYLTLSHLMLTRSFDSCVSCLTRLFHRSFSIRFAATFKGGEQVWEYCDYFLSLISIWHSFVTRIISTQSSSNYSCKSQDYVYVKWMYFSGRENKVTKIWYCHIVRH